MNVHLAGALLAVGIGLYIVGFRGLVGLRPPGPRSRSSAARASAIAWAACTCALGASVMFVVVPVGVTEVLSEEGAVIRTYQTLVETEGRGVLPVLIAPVAITALAALIRNPAVRIALAAIFDALCVLALFSIGAFYAPAAIALTICSCRTHRDGSSRRVGRQISGSPGTPSGGRRGAGTTGTAGGLSRGRQ